MTAKRRLASPGDTSQTDTQKHKKLRNTEQKRKELRHYTGKARHSVSFEKSVKLILYYGWQQQLASSFLGSQLVDEQDPVSHSLGWHHKHFGQITAQDQPDNQLTQLSSGKWSLSSGTCGVDIFSVKLLLWWWLTVAGTVMKSDSVKKLQNNQHI